MKSELDRIQNNMLELKNEPMEREDAWQETAQIFADLLKLWLKSMERYYQTDDQLELTRLTKMALGEE